MLPADAWDVLRVWGTDASETAGQPEPAYDQTDEDVQFTVYRPASVEPERWYPLLAFAHLSQPVVATGGWTLDPVAEVARQSEVVLGAERHQFAAVSEDSAGALPRGGEVTFVPVLPGFEVNPPSRTFEWNEAVHREEFRVRASTAQRGSTVRGNVGVYQGAALVAEVNVTIRVDTGPAAEPPAPITAGHFDKVFMSYSHRNRAVVELVEAVNILNVEYIRDCRNLRAGEDWADRIGELIEQADRFQLFWSTNAMDSEQVRREWSHALRLGRPDFIRPVYWQNPRPARPDRELPPADLDRLHFQFLDFSGVDRLGFRVEAARGRHKASGQTRRGSRRSRRGVVAAAAVAVLALAVGGTLFSVGGAQNETISAPQATSVPSTTDDARPEPVDPGFVDDVPLGQLPDTLGDDPYLDELADYCHDGRLADCDLLYTDSPVSSAYEAFGATCGALTSLDFAGQCASEFDAALNASAEACKGGDMAACDTLYWDSPVASLYEAFGAYCGTRSEEPLAGSCEATISP